MMPRYYRTILVFVVLCGLLANTAVPVGADVPAPGGAGPSLVKAFAAGLDYPSTAMVPFQGRLYFLGSSGSGDYKLWSTDGTELGTMQIASISSALSNSLVATKNALFFFGADSTHGFELWKSDGTAAGTVMVRDIFPGLSSSEPAELTVVHDSVYFTARDHSGGMYWSNLLLWPVQLWKSDGTEQGTVLIKDMPAAPIQAANSLLIGPQRPPALSIYGLMSFGDSLLFGSYEPTVPGANGYHQSLWRTDGTPQATILLKAIGPQPKNGTALLNGVLYFTGDDGVWVLNNGTYGAELWRTNGTAEGTQLVRDIVPGSQGSNPQICVWNGTIIVTASQALWRSDGSLTGTRPILALTDFSFLRQLPPSVLQTPYQFEKPVATSKGFFIPASGQDHYGIWYSNGSPDGSTLVFSSTTPLQVLSTLGDRLLFTKKEQGDSTTSTISFWISDGSTLGTQSLGQLPVRANSSYSTYAASSQNDRFLFLTTAFNSQTQAVSSDLWQLLAQPEAYLALAPALGVAPAGQVSIPVRYGNLGATSGPLTLTLRLPTGVSYVDDTLGVAPAVLSDTLSWSLPALALVENRDAFIRLAIPDAPLGTRYPLSLTITQGSSTTPDDSAALELTVAKQVSLPLVVFR